MKTIKWTICALLICVAQSVWAERKAQAIWCSGNTTLYFTYDELYAVDNEYKGQTITYVWSGDMVTATTYQPDWDYNPNVRGNCTHVVFDPSFINVRPVSCIDWFFDFAKLTAIEGLNYLNTSQVTSMYDMFANCSNLTSIDLSGFRTAEVTTMQGMFYHCQGLTTLDLSTFRTDKVENMEDMFKDCASLETIYVSGGWTTANVTSSSDMFANCNANLTPKVPTVVLNDNADNAADIAYFSGITANVQLQGRTLYANGDWNTICLPFNTDKTGKWAHATIMELSSSSFTGGTLTLYFTDATSIEAGKPYIVKWNDTSIGNLSDPEFQNVTLSNTTNNSPTTYADFVGCFSPVKINGPSYLYLGTNSTLYYPSGEKDIRSCRAYFKLKNGLTAGDPADPKNDVRAFVLNFGDCEASSIENGKLKIENEAGAWYDMQGRRLRGKPTRNGVYIHGGIKKKVSGGHTVVYNSTL